jgi:DNA-binding transcriptional ArsR family regulator
LRDCADSGGHIGDLAGKSACKVRFDLQILRHEAKSAVEAAGFPHACGKRLAAVLSGLRTQNVVYRTKEGTVMGFQQSFKALSDPVRREILSLLRRGPMAAGDIAAHFEVSGATISHHLSVLRDAGLVLDDKQGKYIYYELNMSVVDEILEWISALKGDGRNEKNQ